MELKRRRRRRRAQAHVRHPNLENMIFVWAILKICGPTFLYFNRFSRLSLSLFTSLIFFWFVFFEWADVRKVMSSQSSTKSDQTEAPHPYTLPNGLTLGCFKWLNGQSYWVIACYFMWILTPKWLNRKHFISDWIEIDTVQNIT